MENRTCKIGNSGVIPKVRMCWRSPFVRTSRISPAGCLTISYHKKMGNRVRNQNRVRCLKPRPNHGTESASRKKHQPSAVPFIIIPLPFQASSTVCRSDSIILQSFPIPGTALPEEESSFKGTAVPYV